MWKVRADDKLNTGGETVSEGLNSVERGKNERQKFKTLGVSEGLNSVERQFPVSLILPYFSFQKD